MRFALISLIIYFLVHAVGTAMADISDLEFSEFEMQMEPEMHFEYLPRSHSPRPPRSDDLSQRYDLSNVFQCDGYLTNNPSENFCSETVPDDWTTHEFNGEVYYLVPLSRNSHLTNKPLK